LTMKNELHLKEELVAGGTAGAVARLLVAPLDMLKIRFQIQQKDLSDSFSSQYRTLRQSIFTIYSEEGLLAFWKGNVAAELMVISYCAVQFAAFQNFISLYYAHKIAATGSSGKPSGTMAFLGGGYAGIVATTLTYPLDLLRTRMAAQQQHRLYNSLPHGVSRIVANSGWTGLYTGYATTLLQIAPAMAFNFSIFYSLQHLNGKDETSVWMNLLMGLVSGTSSKFLTMPLDVLKKRIQVQSFEWERSVAKSSEKRVSHIPNFRIQFEPSRGIWSLFGHIIRTEGWTALWKGSVPSLIKAGPNTAITFAVYERVKRLFRDS